MRSQRFGVSGPSTCELQTAVGDLGNGNTTENLLPAGKAITLTGAAGEDLLTQLKNRLRLIRSQRRRADSIESSHGHRIRKVTFTLSVAGH